MFGKLFTLYPQPKDMLELRVRAFIDETRDIPAAVISHGLHRLVRKKTDFAPSVAEIRKECALYLREQHRRASGQDPSSPIEMDADLTERWLKRAAEPVLALPAGPQEPIEMPAPKSERDRAIAILDAEIARLQRNMRVRS